MTSYTEASPIAVPLAVCFRAMGSFSALLRFALAVVLVLNGIGTAVAATRMQLAGAALALSAGPATAKTATAQAMDPSCHLGMAAPATQVETPLLAVQAGAKSQLPGPDCCRSANCGCACVYSTAVVVGALIQPVSYANAVVEWTKAAGHRPPILPHLIRPPIG